MKGITSCSIMAALLAMTVPHAYGGSELALNQTLEPFVIKKYGHQHSLVLADGFWAKAGTDVTATVGNGLLQMLSVVEPGREPADPYSGSRWQDSVLVEIGKNVELPNPTSYYAVDGIGIRRKTINHATSHSGDGWLIRVTRVISRGERWANSSLPNAT